MSHEKQDRNEYQLKNSKTKNRFKQKKMHDRMCVFFSSRLIYRGIYPTHFLLRNHCLIFTGYRSNDTL